MADRADIARRHGIPHLADKLVGETAAELEADAAARAAVIQMLGRPTEPEPVEQPEVDDRSADQLFGDWLSAALRHGAKDERNAAFVRLMHPDIVEGSDE